jgi:hypothetical protein
MVSKLGGVVIRGMVVAVAATIIPFSMCVGGEPSTRVLSVPGEVVSESGGRRVCIPIPECDDFSASFESQGELLGASLIETAYIRDQRIALFKLDDVPDPRHALDVSLTFDKPRGEACVDAGPLTRLCSRTLVGYGISPPEQTMTGPATVARCQNLIECRDASPDILLIVGHVLYPSAYVDSLAAIWAKRMVLNVAIIDVANISVNSPIEVRDFIQDLYSLACAEHYGDGHLGFVVLLGDAYEDDNATRMVPEYDGYGWKVEASDHFYACISGTDNYADLMIGRIPAGNEQELINYYKKLAGYTPVPPEPWTKSIQFTGGCYFAAPEDYVIYFDSLEAYVPEDYVSSRFYRYDYPATGPGDAQATQAMIDSIDAGKLFLFYSGDGDMWDWGARYERVFRSARIPDLDNADRLPIVLSISCSNGHFDNISSTYDDGGVDCFAERLLTQENVGAIACVASSREAGGDASLVFAPEIIRAAFVNGCTFLGELVLEAKTRHLIHLGNVEFVRQFNLFGDPCLNFVLNEYPTAAADLIVRPYSLKITPEFPTPGAQLQIKADIWNASSVFVPEFDVAVYNGPPDSGGTMMGSQTLLDFWGWERRSVTFSIGGLRSGDLDVWVLADAGSELSEMDEANNAAEMLAYVYPCESGFPLKIADEIEGHTVADLNSDGRLDILITSGGTQAQGINADGTPLWTRDDLGLSQWFEGIQPSAFDLNGDGSTEAVLTTRSSILVVEGATGSTMWKKYTDYPVLSPVITDIDGDALFEILAPTFSFSFSTIYAFTASGSYRWVHSLTTYGEKLTGLVVCDVEVDGFKELIYSTDDGNLTCLTCADDPPSTVWEEAVSARGISCLAAGDILRDGTIELAVGCGDTVFIFNAADCQPVSAIGCPCEIDQILLGDMDGDDELEIVATSECGRVFEINGEDIVLDTETGGTLAGCPCLADLDQDGTAEIILTLAEGQIRVISEAGDMIPPVPMRGPCLTCPGVYELDDDGSIEIIAGSSDSLLFILDLGTPGGRIEWTCQGGSPTRSGLHAQPLYGTVSGDLALSGRLDAVGDIIIPEGSSLVLHSCADVRFIHDDVFQVGSAPGQCEIIVYGSFYATGSPAGQVRLGPAAVPHGHDAWAGVLIDQGYASLTKTVLTGAVTGIEFRSGEASIQECVIRNCTLGIKIDEGSPLIDHNKICENEYGISASDATPAIVGNAVISNIYSGIVLSNQSDAVLEDNVVRYTVQGHGLSVYSSSPIISGRNRFEHNSLCGIYLSNSSPAIDSCWIGYNGDSGIKAAYYSDPVIRTTSLVGNYVGLSAYINADPVLGDSLAGLGGSNDIRDNTLYAVYNKTPNVLRAQGNWWGTDSPDPGLFYGQIDYSDWLVTSPAGVEGTPGGLALIRKIYPNPFINNLTLQLYLNERQAPVEVSIYDIRGRLMRSLETAESPGDQVLLWDGRDSHGRQVASGTYFIVVKTPLCSYTRKAILLR